MAVRPLHSSPRLSELMQRNPLPTILGSPSRVGLCFVCQTERKIVFFFMYARQDKTTNWFNPTFLTFFFAMFPLRPDHPTIWIPQDSEFSKPGDLPDTAGYGHRLSLQQDCPSRAQRPGTPSTHTGHPFSSLHPQMEWWYQELWKVVFCFCCSLFYVPRWCNPQRTRVHREACVM